MPGQLLRHEDGSVLSTGATKGHHEVFETTPLIRADTGVHEGHGIRQKLVNAFLPVEIVDHRFSSAREVPETFLPPGIGETAAIEDKSAAVARLVVGQATME